MNDKKEVPQYLIKTEREIFEILKKNKEARKSDNALFVLYWTKKAKHIPFNMFFLCPNLFNACSFTTIERVRRKIQAMHPELKDKEVVKKRAEAQEIYEQYSLNM